ncbi:PLDc N-terminal domain-containing protein [Blastococcus litoris]|uniref:PLDc N-terminal domain-containing protein n=1 Tax=Blastococcus litoris TaxID=2171622 RepID=UPI000E30033C|nr:PLDc N-terminal domain-containing protein [Blastococcus litoris]
MLAAESDEGLPLLDLFWTMLLFFYLALVVWLVVRALRDLFGRDDVGTGARVGWTLFVLALPLVGALAYLVSHERDTGVPDQLVEERDLWRVERSQHSTYVPNFH